ncbi:MAG: beta-glucanase (GH16 family) [Phycisphaerales bacterium]|jgi:beta-glucanase (GH16 family)
MKTLDRSGTFTTAALAGVLGAGWLASGASAQVLVKDPALKLQRIADESRLIWADEFGGTSLDTTKWEYMIGNGAEYGNSGWGNNEWEYYTNLASNTSVGNGLLTITARKQNYQGYQYTSARLRTQGLADFQFGRIEARIKLPSTTGIWPAFWMLPTNSIYGGWAAGGEIDIMESINVSSTTHGTLHYGGQWPANQYRGGSKDAGQDLSNDFHTYGIEWKPDRITWFFDGVAYGSIPKELWYSEAAPGDDNAPFDQQFHFLLNVAVGGNWPGYPDASSVFPQTMQVDYVRVYSFGQKPRSGVAPVMPGRVQMEDFDLGIMNEAFKDDDTPNNGNAYRPSPVDIEPTSGGGFNIGWVEPGEWLEYTLNFPKRGLYTVNARFASGAGSPGGSFGFSIDGEDRSGALSGLNTGGWQNWTQVPGTLRVNHSGEQIVRWENRSGAGLEYNLDWFELTPAAAGMAQPVTTADLDDVHAFIEAYLAREPKADLAEPRGVLDFADIGLFVSEWISWGD